MINDNLECVNQCSEEQLCDNSVLRYLRNVGTLPGLVSFPPNSVNFDAMFFVPPSSE